MCAMWAFDFPVSLCLLRSICVVLEHYKYRHILYEWLDLVSRAPSSEIYQADKASSLINPVRCKEQGRRAQARYHYTAHSPSDYRSMDSVTFAGGQSLNVLEYVVDGRDDCQMLPLVVVALDGNLLANQLIRGVQYPRSRIPALPERKILTTSMGGDDPVGHQFAFSRGLVVYFQAYSMHYSCGQARSTAPLDKPSRQDRASPWPAESHP